MLVDGARAATRAVDCTMISICVLVSASVQWQEVVLLKCEVEVGVAVKIGCTN